MDQCCNTLKWTVCSSILGWGCLCWLEIKMMAAAAAANYLDVFNTSWSETILVFNNGKRKHGMCSPESWGGGHCKRWAVVKNKSPSVTKSGVHECGLRWNPSGYLVPLAKGAEHLLLGTKSHWASVEVEVTQCFSWLVIALYKEVQHMEMCLWPTVSLIMKNQSFLIDTPIPIPHQNLLVLVENLIGVTRCHC